MRRPGIWSTGSARGRRPSRPRPWRCRRLLPGPGRRGPDSGVAGRGDRDRRVLAAFRAVPRALFVPVEAVGQAYLDEPIRIPRGQVTTQPSLIAAMVAVLGLTGGERVLEVGTGLVPDRHPDARPPGGVDRALGRPGRPGAANLARPGWAGSRSWSVTAPSASPSMPPTRRSWSRPPLPGSRGRWSSSSPTVGGWCTRSGRAATSRSPPSPGRPIGWWLRPAWYRPGSSPRRGLRHTGPGRSGRAMTVTVALAGTPCWAVVSPGLWHDATGGPGGARGPGRAG